MHGLRASSTISLSARKRISILTVPMPAISISIFARWATSVLALANSTCSARWRVPAFPVEAALARIGAPQHVRAFVAHTMALANSGTTEEVLAAFFHGREDIIPEMFRRLLQTLYGAKHNDDRLRHFVYYIDRHIELDGDSHGPKGRELLEGLIANSPHKNERALCAACSSIEARIDLWNGTLSKLRNSRGLETTVSI